MQTDRSIDTLEQLLERRYSCRGFRPEPVPRPTIERILALAQRTASWCNAQPWQVLLVSGSATQRFRQVMLAAMEEPETPDFPFPEAYLGAYQQRRRACGLALYEAVGVRRGDREASARQARENFRFFGAPHVAILTSPKALGVYGAVDCGAYASSFMLAATSLGVASIAQASLATHPQRIREHFALPDDRLVVCAISFGWPDEAHPANAFRTSRAALAEAVAFFD